MLSDIVLCAGSSKHCSVCQMESFYQHSLLPFWRTMDTPFEGNSEVKSPDKGQGSISRMGEFEGISSMTAYKGHFTVFTICRNSTYL